MKKLLFLLFLLPSVLFAQKPGDYKHDPSQWVDDQENIFTPQEKAQLSELIKNFFDTTQIGLLTVPSFGEYDPNDFALQVGRDWGVGGKSNNGLMIVLSKHDRKMSVQTGYGVEGLLPDGLVVQYQHDYAIPRFKEDNYFQGTYDLIKAYIGELNGTAKHDRQVAEELRQKEVEAERQHAAELWAKTKDVLWNIFLGLLLITGAGFALWYIRKRQKEREAYMADLKKKTDNARSELRRLVDLGTKAQQTGIPEGKNLVDQIQNYGLDPDLEIASEQGHLNYLHKYDEIDHQTQSLEDQITAKMDALKKANSFYFSTVKVEDYKSNIDVLERSVKNLVLDKQDYSRFIQLYKDNVTSYASEYQVLGKLIADRQFDKFNSQISKIRGILSGMSGYEQTLTAAINQDNDKVQLAKSAKGKIRTQISELRQFIGREGTTSTTNTQAGQKLNALENDLSGFGDDLVNNLALYSLLTARLADCNGPKREYQAYLAEEERKRKAEEDRLRRIREAEEEERRRQRRIQEEAEEASRRSSYSSSYDSGSSSSGWGSSDSGSSFGGGSFGGGGGSSSW